MAVLWFGAFITSLMFMEVEEPACPCGCTCTDFPAVAPGVWISYVAWQVLNRVPIGWEWKNDLRQTSDRLLLVFALVVFVAAFTIRASIPAGYWIGGAIVIVAWQCLRTILGLITSRQYPLPNRLVGTGIGLLFDAPLLLVCITALANSK